MYHCIVVSTYIYIWRNTTCQICKKMAKSETQQASIGMLWSSSLFLSISLQIQVAQKPYSAYHFNKKTSYIIHLKEKTFQHHQNPSFFKPKPYRDQPSTYFVTNFIGHQRGWFPTRLWLQSPGTTLSNHLEVTCPQTFQATIPSLEAKGTPSKATPNKKMALRVINHHCPARGLVGIGRGWCP